MNWALGILFLILGIARIATEAMGHSPNSSGSGYVMGVIFILFAARRFYRAVNGD